MYDQLRSFLRKHRAKLGILLVNSLLCLSFSFRYLHSMKYSHLGQTDLQVSRICLGTMTFGEQNSEAEGHKQLNYAFSQGINFIDTAELYSVPGRPETQGSTERIIGTWLTERKNRDQVVIGTKVTGPSEGLKHIRNPLNFSPEQIRTAIDGSLQRLQTDYVDLYQLHWPERKSNFFGKLGYEHDPADPWEDNFLEVLRTMQELKEAGKIRHIGLSNETPWGLMRCLQLAEQHNLPRVLSVQNPYNLLNRSFEVGLAEIAMRESTGLLAYSPLAFGLLTGKYRNGAKPKNGRITLFSQLSRYNNQACEDATEAYAGIAVKNRMRLSQLSLAYINSRPFLTSNIIGATNMEQLKENIRSIELTLSPEVIQAIDEVHARISNPGP
jgi:aryl-alcohol dehydrogenase-like predicted oxidoreductase